MFEILIGKGIDIALSLLQWASVRVFGFLSPIKIKPKQIELSNSNNDWGEIRTIRITNRLNRDLYDVYIGALTKEARENFDIKVVWDNIPNAQTVEHMKINTNVLIVFAEDKNTKNQLWVVRLHRLGSREQVEFKVKIKSTKPVYLKPLGYNFQEISVRERDNGQVIVPFTINSLKKLPRIRGD